MSKRLQWQITPGAVVLLAVFIYVASPLLAAAILLAAVCHEMGHYLTLCALGAGVRAVRISALGAEMEVEGRSRLSYGGELLSTLAGPLTNLVLALLLARTGQWAEIFYPLAGAQLVLGCFNLLPIRPLDGSSILWIIVACLKEPFTADRVTDAVSAGVAVLLAAGGAWLALRQGGSPFLLVGAVGLLAGVLRKKVLVKRKKNR